MDPFSALASAIALAQGLAAGIQWFRDALGASQDYKNVDRDIQELLNLLRELQARAQKTDSADEWFESFRHLVDVPDGALTRLIDRMENKVPKFKPTSKWKMFPRALVWSWRKQDIEDLFNEVARSKANIQLMVAMKTMDVSVAIDTRLQRVDQRLERVEENQTTERKERLARQLRKDWEQITAWLSPLNFHPRHRQLSEESCPMTGDWLLATEEFKAWITGRPWTLFCYGMAGAGKTILSCTVVNYLQRLFEKRNVAILYLYIDHKDSKNQTYERLIGSILKQLIECRPSYALSDDLVEMYREAKRKDTWPDLNEIREMLILELENFDRTYLVVDALDECPDESFLLDELQSLLSENLSLMVTYRSLGNEYDPKGIQIQCNRCQREYLPIYHHCGICSKGGPKDYDICQSCYEKYPYCNDESHELTEPRQVRVEIKARDVDVERYVHWEVEKQKKLGTSNQPDYRVHDANFGTTPLGDLCRAEPALEDDITNAIVNKAKGRFLLAKLYMESLKLKLSLEDVTEALATLPEKEDESYEEIMQRIDDEYEGDRPELAKRLLSWIVCTHRLLSFAELEQAMAVRSGDTDYKPRRRYQPDHLLKLTAGLITIGPNRGAVRLVHSTAQDYFLRNRDKWFKTARTDISVATLTYLNFETFLEPCQGKNEDIDFDNRLRKYPFLSYASQYWGIHAFEEGCGTQIRNLVLQFVHNPGRLASAVQAVYYLDSRNATSWDVRKGVNSLHVCAWFGLDTVIIDLVETNDASSIKKFIDSQDFTYQRTALMYACKRGHVTTVAKLLELGASPNIRSKSQSTALFDAVLNREPDTVQVLLKSKELDINAKHPQYSNRTALMLAAMCGNEKVVELLLQNQDVLLNQQDQQGFTALSLATSANDSAIVRRLLAQPGISVNLQENDGGSALIIAAIGGNEDIVNQLIEKGADTSLKDKENGSTALLHAVNYGNISVVKTMLAHGVDMHSEDDMGRSLLHGASLNRRRDVVQLLISAGLDPNIQGKRGETPLHDACRNGDIDMIEALLVLKADKSIKDIHERTPRDVAWQNCHLAALNYIDGKEDFEDSEEISDYPNAKSLPLWSATKLGRVDLVKAIIESGDNLDDQKDPDTNDTALHVAVPLDEPEIQNEIFYLLLEANMEPNPINENKRTPLHIAAFHNQKTAAELLIEYHADLELRDQWGDTPLLLARRNERYEVAIKLIEAGAVVHTEGPHIQPLFFAAVDIGSLEAVKVLLQKNSEPQAKNSDGLTALQVAKKRGYGEIMQLLRENKTFVVLSAAENAKHEEDPPEDLIGEAEDSEEREAPPEVSSRGPHLSLEPFKPRSHAQTATEEPDSMPSLLQGLGVSLPPGDTFHEEQDLSKEPVEATPTRAMTARTVEELSSPPEVRIPGTKRMPVRPIAN